MVGVPGDGLIAAGGFTWRDGERVIAAGRGRAAEAVELAGGPGFSLLTTGRALAWPACRLGCLGTSSLPD